MVDKAASRSSRNIPQGRASRLGKLGSLATGIVGGVLAEGARQLAQGNRPKMSDLLLTSANARRVANQLAQLRGAAMKVGQLLSMDAGDILPRELTDILSRLRADAEPMPFGQLVGVLHDSWGGDWEQRFRRFSFEPIACASIGQVHDAHTRDGRHVALKVQYPGVRRSIDSDVDNVATLLRISGLLPKTLNIEPLLGEAKLQLHAEADYLREAQWLERFGSLLENEEHYQVPAVYRDLTTTELLAMEHVGGVPIEALAESAQAVRDNAMQRLMVLLFREIFEFQLVQTDPNFANYFYDSDSDRLVLLDFGATREYPDAIIAAYRALMQGAIDGDRAAMTAAATDIGFFQEEIRAEQREAVIDLFMQACEPLRCDGVYDFGSTDLARRISDAGMALSLERDYWHTPPADAVFLHRKLAGMYLLAARLGARVDVRRLFQDIAGA